MKKTSIISRVILLCSGLLLVLPSLGEGSRVGPLLWGDQHNGTYKNPVLNADYSDPDVIRVDDKYYMVASDFHFMGMQVLESSDLVNWQIISQIYDRFDLPGWDENAHYGGGSWAPAIRWHNGLYYVYFCTPDEGLFMSTAEDPHGPWSPLHCVKAIDRWEDPCPFWDDDGQAYLGRSRRGAGPIIIHKMSPDGRTLLDDGVTVYTGPTAEGTKIYKRHGYYYLIIPEGGVCCGWQTVLRSRNIYGPYEKRVALEQGSTDVNGPHQGALVDVPSPTGGEPEWWFYHFQETHPAGRVVHLQPARWTADDWLLIGVDIDGNGIGEPVSVWEKPKAHPLPLPKGGEKEAIPFHLALSDEFNRPFGSPLSSRRGVGGEVLFWQWNHNPVDSAWSLSERRGWLTLHALPLTSGGPSPLRGDRGEAFARNSLTQKTVGFESEATTRLDCTQLADADNAGLLCMANHFMGLGVTRQDGRLHLYLEQDGQRTIIAPLRTKTVLLRITVDSSRNRHQFAYSTDGKTFTPVGEPFDLRMGNWKGSRVGLFCYTSAPHPGGKAQFDYFHYEVLK